MPAHHPTRTSPSQVERRCEICQTVFFAPPWCVRRGGARFCDRECSGVDRRRAPRRERQFVNGYVLIVVEGRLVSEHRWVMEHVIGRPLLSSEHVHHVNGKRDDNSPENLVVMSRSEHTRLHRREQSERARRPRMCTTCQRTVTKIEGKGMCPACYARQRRINRNGGVYRPPMRLTDDDVATIRALRPTCTLRILAERFGVSKRHISAIARGESRRTPRVIQ